MSVSRSTIIAMLLALCSCGRTTPPQTDVPPADPRVGLKAGLMNAGEAISNLKVVAKAVSPSGFLGITNSDLAFVGNYVIQGNYNFEQRGPWLAGGQVIVGLPATLPVAR